VLGLFDLALRVWILFVQMIILVIERIFDVQQGAPLKVEAKKNKKIQ
jgi:hypothetical protein